MIKKVHRITVALILIFQCLPNLAQKHEWAKSVHAKLVPEPNALYEDDNNNTYMVGDFMDSLFWDSTQFIGFNPYNKKGSFFIKTNSVGTFQWCVSFFADNGIKLRQVNAISNNKIVVYGQLLGSKIKFSKNDSIMNGPGANMFTGFMAFYDSSGNFLTASRVYTGDSYGSKNQFVNWYNNELTIDGASNWYLSFYKSNIPGFIHSNGGFVGLNDSIEKYIVVKYNRNFDSILWYKEFPKAPDFSIISIRTGSDNNLYLACNVSKINFNLGSHYFTYQNYSNKGFLTVLSQSGNFLKGSLINEDSTQIDCLYDVAAIDSNQIYIIGNVQDSVINNGKSYKSLRQIPKKKFYSYGFVGLLGLNTGVKWLQLTENQIDFRPDDIIYASYPYSKLKYNSKGFVYACFLIWGDTTVSIGGLKDAYLNPYLFVKFDVFGNALWLRQVWRPVVDLVLTNDNNVVYAGSSGSDITIDPFKLKGKAFTYLTKSKDYAITRGIVWPGPYCAGDTLKIPYVKYGEYDSSNYFIAELSDENGNFYGGERQLGRLKSSQSGSIHCTIPHVKVYTSKNYRIRIRSTNPPVQSFHLYDTLKLLIYSRDKADPGPTESICKGDSLRLNTFGGTKWTWSPQLFMDDSTKRQPLVWTPVTQTYRIIIADSSGCGEADTAFKTIYVRTPLKIKPAFTDTAVCGGSILLPVYFTGGDSSYYHWQWHYVVNNKLWFGMKKGSLKLRDTLLYFPADPFETLALTLTDSCNHKQDTVYFKTGLRSSINISSLKDTSLCLGQKLNFKARASGGNQSQYQWQWRNLSDNSILSQNDSLTFSPGKNTKIELTVNDGCAELGDTQTFMVSVNQRLSSLIQSTTGVLQDTSICYNQKLKLSAKVTGGSKNYTYKWFIEDVLIGDSSDLDFGSASYFPKTGGTKQLKLFVDDQCTLNPDTVVRKIRVLENPIANLSVGSTCNLNPVSFMFTGSFPSSSVDPKYQWIFDRIDSSDQKDPFYKYSSSGTKNVFLKITADNGCKDTISRSVLVNPQAKADFQADDVCEDSSVNFINHTLLSDGMVNYTWYFGDGLTSTTESPVHKYVTNGVTMTFNVKMVANVPGGCSDSVTKAVTVHAYPVKGFTFTTSFQTVNFLAKESNGDLYEWDFGDGGTASTNKPDQSYTYTKFPSGKYKACLKVTNLAGCSSDTCVEILISGSIFELSQIGKINVYPNPADDLVNILCPQEADYACLYNMAGLEIIRCKTINGFANMSTERISKGIYLLQIFDGNSVLGRVKIIKQ